MRPVQRMLVALALLAACGKDADNRAPVPARYPPLGQVPPDPTNRVADDPRAAALGQMLFFDPDLSGPLKVDSALGKAGERGKVSCRTCHDGPALDDAGSPTGHVSTGTGIGGRNAPPVLNSSFYAWTNWGGRFDSQWALVLGAIENPEVMNNTPAAVAETVLAQYRAEYEAIFPGPTDDADVVFANTGKAIAAYMRTLVARDAPFDRFAAGDEDAISPAAKRGFQLFLRHCESCHRGPHFQDDSFHAIGIHQFGAHVPETDLGRFTDVVPLLASRFNTAGPHSDGPSRLGGLAQDPAQRGQFRTPSLRNVEVTAPYMHAGQLATLEAVVAFYNIGGGAAIEGVTKSSEMKRLDLSAEEQADLVAFMKTLTDTRVPAELLVDTSR